jgi:UDP-N-acetylmuramyl tripeptide synthase
MGTLGIKIDSNQPSYLAKSFINTPKRSLTTFEPSDLYKNLNYLVEQDVSHLAIEASSHGLDQFRLDGINFSGGIFTNLSHDHLDYHKNMEQIIFLQRKGCLLMF